MAVERMQMNFPRFFPSLFRAGNVFRDNYAWTRKPHRFMQKLTII